MLALKSFNLELKSRQRHYMQSSPAYPSDSSPSTAPSPSTLISSSSKLPETHDRPWHCSSVLPFFLRLPVSCHSCSISRTPCLRTWSHGAHRNLITVSRFILLITLITVCNYPVHVFIFCLCPSPGRELLRADPLFLVHCCILRTNTHCIWTECEFQQRV